jgi:hypothetical protein
MTLTRSRAADTFGLAAEAGPYGFWPVLPPGLDPQFHASLNDRRQPFHLVHEHDAVLVHLTGRGSVVFPEGPVRWHPLMPGDHVYLPAGLPYRVVTSEPCVQLLLKADVPALEAVAFYCASCDQLVYRVDFDLGGDPVQRHYHRICSSFNENDARRRCSGCGTVATAIDLTPYAWLDLADRIDAGDR